MPQLILPLIGGNPDITDRLNEVFRYLGFSKKIQNISNPRVYDEHILDKSVIIRFKNVPASA
jgi:hypothetical protein